MNLPFWLGKPLEDEVWQTVKLRTVFEFCKWDIQSEDRCVLANFPLVIEESKWRDLCALAEGLSAELVAAEKELVGRCELHKRLGLPKALEKEFGRMSRPTPGTPRVMRFDFHFTDEGWRISEVNADVPGGFIEASGFTRLIAAHYPGTILPPDPADEYANALVKQFGMGAVAGLVHATAYSDDRQVMQYLGMCIAARGARAIMASPAHIQWDNEHARIESSFAKSRVDVLVRFFPAEWLPALRARSQWAPFFTRSRTPISNPGSAILVQSKRFPLVWEDLYTSLPTWKAVLPETRCPASLSPSQLEEWVLKPTLGRVGEDVAIAGVTPKPALEQIQKAAKRRPSEWVAQRRFTILSAANGQQKYYPCVGVFTIDGRVAGAYGRIGRSPLIDGEAQDIAVLISCKGGNV